MHRQSITSSLSFQLISRTVGAISVSLAIAFLGLYLAIEHVIDKDIDADMHEDIHEFRAVFADGGDAAVIEEMTRETLGGESESVFLRLLDSNNTTIHNTDLQHWGIMPVGSSVFSRLAANADASILSTIEPERQDISARVIVGHLGPGRVLQIGESLESRDDIMELLLSAFAFVFLAALPVAALFGWMATKRATHGISAVSHAAAQIRGGNLNSRVTAAGQPGEIQFLADSFNSMASRINSLINDMREMTDNIAHDLRSPLGRIRAIAETALTGDQTSDNYRYASEQCIAECDRLIKLINASLDVAETEAGVARLTIEPVDLATLAEEACELFDPVADEKNIQLIKAFDNDSVINGDRQSLLRMLLNLIDNAVKYTPVNGQVKVSVAADEGQRYLEVADNGIGIPEHEKKRVFDRFYRCDQSRTDDGCGLGLSFAQAVAKLHGGQIVLHCDSVYTTIFRVSFTR